MARALVLTMAVAFLAGCPNNDTPTTKAEWVRFNGDDEVDVRVTDVDCDGLPLIADLSSTTGETRIGTVTVDPGCGPVGTAHRVTVDLLTRDYGTRVQRAEFEADSETRGVWLISMEQDSADERVWVRDVTSYGEPTEDRVDVFRILLFEVDEDPVPAAE